MSLSEWSNRPASREPLGHLEPGRPQRRQEPPAAAPAAAASSALRRRGEEALRAALAAAGTHRSSVRYRGFVLLPQADLGWLVRPERSPMTVLPFRTPPISLSDVKALVDWRLDGAPLRVRGQERPRR